MTHDSTGVLIAVLLVEYVALTKVAGVQVYMDPEMYKVKHTAAGGTYSELGGRTTCKTEKSILIRLKFQFDHV